MLLIMSSCLTYMGGSLMDGALDKLETKGPKSMKRLVGSAGEALRDSVLNKQTQARIDSLLTEIMQVLSKEAQSMRDSLLDDKMSVLLSKQVNTVLGDSTQLYIKKIRDELLGKNTKTLPDSLRAVLLGDKTLADVKAMRDELLGPTTQNAAVNLIDSAMTRFVFSYKKILSRS